jgi:ABC-type uncharacterized transport system substrate-binding protein
MPGLTCGVSPRPAGSGLGCRPQCTDRHPLERGQCRPDPKICCGIGRARPRHHLGQRHLAVTALQRINRTLPIVFAAVADPVGAGIVDSLAHPGGNATGFMNYEYNLAAKYLELLKEIAPRVTRVAIIRNAAHPAGVAQFGALQNAARLLGVETSPVNVRDAREIERSVEVFARLPNGGLVVTQTANFHRDLIITLAARHKLSAVYGLRYDVTGGGLISYGPDIVDQFRQVATYVDRILKGAKHAHLPVQAPTKYQLVINLKTAKALGLEVPATLLARADEVIE